jgi:hypothetical protein
MIKSKIIELTPKQIYAIYLRNVNKTLKMTKNKSVSSKFLNDLILNEKNLHFTYVCAMNFLLDMSKYLKID